MERRELEELMNMESAEELAIHEIPEEDLFPEDNTIPEHPEWFVSAEDLKDAEEFFGGRPVNMPTRVDGEKHDGVLGAYNRRLFATRRGRVCEHPGCDTKVRYTKDVQLCSAHE